MANLSRIAFVLRTIPNLNSEEITGIYPGELFLVGDKKAIFYKQEDGTVISPSEAASTFMTIKGNLEEVSDKAKARENLELKSAALKDAGTEAGTLYSIGDFNSFINVSNISDSLDFNTYNFRSNEVIVISKASATNVPDGLDLATISIINILATGTSTNGGFVAIVSDMSNLKPSYLVRCSITNSIRSFSVEAIYTSKHKPSMEDLNTYSRDDANDRFMQISNLFSEIIEDEDKEIARMNLDLGTAAVLDKGMAKGNVIVVGDNGLGSNSNPVSSAKSTVPAFFQLTPDSTEKPVADKDYGFISFPINSTISGYLRLSSDGELHLGIDNGNSISYTKVYLANNKPTLSELKALGSENNLSDLTDKVAARENLELGNSATKNIGTEAGTVAEGNDARIVGALQLNKNLDDLANKSQARANLELGTAAQKDVQTSLTDSTAERLIKTGAFGVGGRGIWLDLTDGVDFFTLLSTLPTGFYSTGANSVGALNFPFANGWADFIVTKHYSDDKFRTVIALSISGEMAIATQGGNTWSDWYPIITEVNSNLILPIGVPIPYPLATPPKNFLKANGSAFDQVAFPKLLSYYPSGYLPDLRGEFIRGWDDGRNVDTGRAILTLQAATAITDYQGGGGKDRPPRMYYRNQDSVINAGGGFVAYGAKNSMDTISGYTSYIGMRPRNIAFNYIIRAK